MVEPNLLTVFETPPDRPEESLPVVDLPGVPTEVEPLPVADLPVIDLRPTQEVSTRLDQCDRLVAAALGKPKSKKKPQPQTRQLAPWQKLPPPKPPKKTKGDRSKAKRRKPM